MSEESVALAVIEPTQVERLLECCACGTTFPEKNLQFGIDIDAYLCDDPLFAHTVEVPGEIAICCACIENGQVTLEDIIDRAKARLLAGTLSFDRCTTPDGRKSGYYRCVSCRDWFEQGEGEHAEKCDACEAQEDAAERHSRAVQQISSYRSDNE